MSLGQNLQFLRKMRNRMTQEELAEKLNVSRQTISKWELDAAYPEIDKVVELCKLFSCTMDELVMEDMNVIDETHSVIRVEEIDPFSYIQYSVVSADPKADALVHVKQWAKELDVKVPEIIGWDFPVVSQEQINIYNMHGYTVALILNRKILKRDLPSEVIKQNEQKYIAITIKQPFLAPFRLIPNAYDALLRNMKINGIKQKTDKNVLTCFEKEYVEDGVDYMDVYIAIE